MRTCEKNKRLVWYSNTKIETDAVDEEGNYTGEIIEEYTDIKSVKIQLYPSKGDVTAKEFGITEYPEYVSVTDKPIFTKDTVIFLTEPESEAVLADTYDLKVIAIKESMNYCNYAFAKK